MSINPCSLENAIVFERLFFNNLNTDIKAIRSLSLVNQRIRDLASSAITTMVKYTLSPSFPFQFNYIVSIWGVANEFDKESLKEQIIVQTHDDILRGKEPNQYLLGLQERDYNNSDFDKLLLLHKKT